MVHPIDIYSARRVVAVLTEITLTNDGTPSFGTIHEFCEELNQLVTEAGDFFYVFSLTGFSSHSVHGYYFTGSNWKKEELPLPDVIYNRVHSRRTEAKKSFAAFLQETKELHISVFNDRFLTKWEVHQWLSKRRNLQSFLPETCLFSERTFKQMHAMYEDLYLKPLTGSQGNGIIWLPKEQNEIVFTTRKEMKKQSYSTKEELIKALKEKTNHRAYLLQQGIPLIENNDKRLDFRILCHRENDHQWKVTSNVARLSAKNQFASNVALGGEVLRPLTALTPVFGRETASWKLELMKELSLECADCISENVSGLMGELGIDLGVDERGELWVIEVNSKPSKNMDKKKRIIRPSAKAIVSYCYQLIANSSEGEKS